MSKSLFSIPILFLLLLQIGYAQNPTGSSWIAVADTAFEKRDYYSAFKYYEAALAYDTTKLRIWYQYAESARHFNAYLYAERAYQKILDSDSSAQYPLSGLWLAAMEQKLSKYQEAIGHYQQFLDDQKSAETKYKDLAAKGLRDSNFALKKLEQPENVKIIHLDEKINTPYSDFGAVLVGDTLYYSSFRFVEKQDTNNPPRIYAKTLSSIKNEGGVLLPDTFNIAKNHVAHTAFNSNGNRLYYNICDYSATTAVRCDLYFREKDKTGKWSAARKLSVNLPNVSSTQPSVALDAQSGRELLFFSSDRAGGKGGLDIWCGYINPDGDVTSAGAVAAINSPGNEGTPFFHNASQQLYFSSDGIEGMGGYDIFQSYQIGESWANPQHLGYPINTSYDDLYLTFSKDGTKAYLSSNRLGSTFIEEDKEACCLDIFTYNPDLTINLIATTFNLCDGSPLIGTTVELVEITPEGEKLIGKVTNLKGNDFPFPLQKGKKYLLRARKEGFSEALDTIDLNAPAFKGLNKIERQLYLGPSQIDLQANTFRKADGTPLLASRVELYEIGPDGKPTLINGKDNPTGNDFIFPLEKGKKYLLKAMHDGYLPVTDTVDLTKDLSPKCDVIKRDLYLPQLQLQILACDASNNNTPLNGVKVGIEMVGKTSKTAEQTQPLTHEFFFELDLDKPFIVINASKDGYIPAYDTLRIDVEESIKSGGIVKKEVCLRRTTDWPGFLPLALYFDNDEPDRRTYSRFTRKTYGEAYEQYYGKKKEFIEEFTRELSEEDKFLTEQRFEVFFEREVKGGYNNLVLFSDQLYEYLKRGNSLEIEIKGYASPRGNPFYNECISERRINSLKNHFSQYNNGCLMPYLKSGKFKIIQKPLGESTVDVTQVSDNLKDAKNSIYSILASVERRVEIVQINTGNKEVE